jgi:hypothetical protein
VALLAAPTGWATPASSGPAHPVAEASVQQEEPGPPEADGSTTTSATAVPGEEMIPEPNEGRPPQDAGDRGGWLQLGLLVVILVAVGLIAWRVVVEARRNRERAEGLRSSGR